ncbi:teicoplanin resistance protein VanZ [Lactobacillus sp. LC28-10]|uniref:Teicoplanin resistance protein VanZ n=1 Tax=Secundilactobacillus angelensis TaxID=2722706 RepID=A0ABX1KZL6_9LACO|nr:VanZ family protein [Secundilactobacillus angelensis]MCH5461541.1 VanZ family protein [Secundilactobacillus angelensis]NLR19376.1 teicoplanin resistance protein VanZ [Secundilactobacillus angelensis]
MVYLFDIRMAMLAFPLIALLITFPVLLWHYHRFGAISRWSIVMLYSFVFYLLCAYFLIILPLPSMASVAKLTTPRYNLQPLLFIREFIDQNPFQLTNPQTWLAAVKNPTVVQPLFNIVLTIPFGFYLRGYFRKSWWQTIIISFCLSLFFELTQLSGDYGIYPRSYRLFDVDDLLLNTTGGIIGYWLTGIVLPLLPTSDRIKERLQVQARQVSFFRHATSFVVDWGLFTVLSTVVNALLGNVKQFSQIVALISLMIVALVPQFIWRKTFGMRLVHLKVANMAGQQVTNGQICRRWLMGYSLFLVPIVIGGILAFIPQSSQLYMFGGIGMVLILGLIGIILGLDMMIDIFRPQHALLFERWSRTVLISDYQS